MRLLNVKTMRLEEFFEKSIPKYAIVSHTWSEDEVTFREFDPVLGPRRTSKKIDGCCTQTIENGFDYVWIDTCCIDKSSSAELSEAINSMFAWYSKSEICYVYLSDVESCQIDNRSSDFWNCRWFSRGWTLQELLAPRFLKFYNSSWYPLGSLAKQGSPMKYTGDRNLTFDIAAITKIPYHFINGGASLIAASIAMRMSWASARQTTRIEDMAYSLLGIFDIAMPLLYGEGTKAFMRLQEEIIKNEDDLSILAWGFRGGVLGGTSCFASSPFEFAGSGVLDDDISDSTCPGHVVLTNKGLYMDMSIVQLTTGDYIGRVIEGRRHLKCFVIPLVRHRPNGKEAIFYRPPLNIPQWVNAGLFENINPQPVYISKSTPKLDRWNAGIRLSPAFLEELQVKEVHPPNWNLSDGWCLMSLEQSSQALVFDQMILLRCNNKRGDTFAIRINYEFARNSYTRGRSSSFSPLKVKLLASPMILPTRPYNSMVELIVGEGHEVGSMLDWQEKIVLERRETSGVDGSAQILDGCTLRLHLDGTERNEWKIDVVDVSDSDVGEDWVQNSLYSNEPTEYSDSSSDSDSLYGGW